MTKKHFETIARTLYLGVKSAENMEDDIESANTLILLSNLIQRFEYDFADFNDNFDPLAFRVATGINEATKELF